jgi:hypothetical protein
MAAWSSYVRSFRFSLGAIEENFIATGETGGQDNANGG